MEQQLHGTDFIDPSLELGDVPVLCLHCRKQLRITYDTDGWGQLIMFARPCDCERTKLIPTLGAPRFPPAEKARKRRRRGPVTFVPKPKLDDSQIDRLLAEAQRKLERRLRLQEITEPTERTDDCRSCHEPFTYLYRYGRPRSVCDNCKT